MLSSDLPTAWLPHPQDRGTAEHSSPNDSDSEHRGEQPPPPPPSTEAVTAQLIEGVCATLREPGAKLLAALPAERIWTAWRSALEPLLTPCSLQRQALRELLPKATGLSTEGAEAALDAVLSPLRGARARSLILDARPSLCDRPALVVLAGNVPGLALQPLLSALAARRPLLFKSARNERWVTPSFLQLLAAGEPALGRAAAALCWPGGDRDIDRAAATACGTIAVYGDRPAIDAWRELAGERLLPYGPKLSVAIVSRKVDLDHVCAGIARDVALFDQRGCLSIQLVLSDAPLERLSRALAEALGAIAVSLPPGVQDPRFATAAAAIRDRAILEGRRVEGALGLGLTVESRPPLLTSPGLRLVRIYSVDPLANSIDLLQPLRAHLQGAILEGAEAWGLKTALSALGVSRCSPAGELQLAGADWNNGGIDLLASFSSPRTPDPR